MRDCDNSPELQQQVRDAVASATPLKLRGGDTKNFYGNEVAGELLDVGTHKGIVSYEPTELVITVRAGTTLRDIESALAAQNQMLAFEPPSFGNSATIGGTIACNFSGPRRPYAGAARDFMLGCKIINGKAEILNFGGQVMKNVAGYDVSRLMAGAMGTLGVLLEVSLKVLPKPETEITLIHTMPVIDSLQKIHQWQRLPLPVSACCFGAGALYLRLSGTADAVKQAQQNLGGDTLADTDGFWEKIKEHQFAFFNDAKSLWRISLPSGSAPLSIAGEWFYDWGGAQRWLKTSVAADEIRAVTRAAGGYATLFRGDDQEQKFHALSPGLMKIHQQLKHAFDPRGLFNRGRLYPDF